MATIVKLPDLEKQRQAAVSERRKAVAEAIRAYRAEGGMTATLTPEVVCFLSIVDDPRPVIKTAGIHTRQEQERDEFFADIDRTIRDVLAELSKVALPSG